MKSKLIIINSVPLVLFVNPSLELLTENKRHPQNKNRRWSLERYCIDLIKAKKGELLSPYPIALGLCCLMHIVATSKILYFNNCDTIVMVSQVTNNFLIPIKMNIKPLSPGDMVFQTIKYIRYHRLTISPLKTLFLIR